jgi:hypothetical protein
LDGVDRRGGVLQQDVGDGLGVDEEVCVVVGVEVAAFIKLLRNEIIGLTPEADVVDNDRVRDLKEGRELVGSKDWVFGGVCIVASPSCYESN